MDWHWMWRSRAFRLCGLVSILILLISVIILIFVFSQSENLTPLEKAELFLAEYILFDGYNDFATNMRSQVYNDLNHFNFSQNLTEIEPWASDNFSRTDLPRLKAGGVKAQFWVARAECLSQSKDAVEITLEQIDVLKRLIGNYSSEMAFVTSYSEVMEAVKEKKIASLIFVCCGHSIQWSFGILRMYYELGVRGLNLVQTCSTPWADVEKSSSQRKTSQISGLSAFGEEIIFELNRLGMIIDISHSSVATMKEVLIVSRAPVVFSHSAAKSICNSERNIPDDILKLVRQKDAVIMVTFYPGVLKCDGGIATIADVIEHIEYFRNRTTVDNIGIGSDYDAVDATPEGLEDVSKFPNLFAALIETERWSVSDLEKLAGRNILRVLQEVEDVRENLKEYTPKQSWIKIEDFGKNSDLLKCQTIYTSPVQQPTTYNQPYDPSHYDSAKYPTPKIKWPQTN